MCVRMIFMYITNYLFIITYLNFTVYFAVIFEKKMFN